MTHEIKRVVVPLDAACEMRTAIDTAARLAARWQVPLHGVFIEDEELIGLAELPFAREVTLATGIGPLTKAHIEDQLRAFAGRAKHEFKAAADRHDVNWSFEVARGPLTADTFGGAEDDLVVASAVTRPIGSYFRIPSRWWAAMAVITRPLLLARRQWETGGSVLALLRRRGPEAAHTLDIAAQIADFCSGSLIVAGTSDLAGADFAAWVSGLLEGHSLAVEIESVAESDALRQRIIELDCRLLVATANADKAQADELRELIEHLACDVLVVR